MQILGITGGIGSGKSTVLEYLATQPQVIVYEADKIAHMLQQPGQSCYQQIVEAFGTGVLNNKQEINRKILGGMVFSNTKELERLNAIVHPAVHAYVTKLIEESHETPGILVIEAALLLEDHYDEQCDEVWYIYCADEERRHRLAVGRGYSSEKYEEIKKTQLSEEVFRKACDVEINNSTTPEELHLQLERELRRFLLDGKCD